MPYMACIASSFHGMVFEHRPCQLGFLGCSQGYVQAISKESLHQLHIFIFVLAVIHVVYSCLTILVGLAQVSI